jgi:RNA polymerase sigma factor for flagellar operon FliA
MPSTSRGAWLLAPRDNEVRVSPLTTPRELLLANLDLLRELVRSQARRGGLSDEDREELESYVRLRLVEQDYAILRRFEGRSTLRTYLTIVIQRLYFDFGNRNWGKWRPSAQARRLGPLAEALEGLLYRRGLSFDDACRLLLAEPEWGKPTRRQIAELADHLPRRPSRRAAPAGASPCDEADQAPDPEHVAVRRDMAATVGGALAAAFRRQPARDRLILRLRFVEGLSVPEIARALAVPAKPLYKRIEGLLAVLRADLRAAGVGAGDVVVLLSSSPELDLPGDPLGEFGESRPSNKTDDDERSAR